MNISKNWLNQYVDAGDDLAGLCNKLTMAGIEVEAVNDKAVVPANVVAAKILERAKHPNADKLSVCKVFDGTRELQIVCGAPNCDAGKIVPLAQIGTDFGGGFVIKKAKMRGVESFGMMCSASELGISDDADGLLELPEDTVPGTPLNKIYASDTEIEIEVTPNRPDWLCHYGVARDVAALLDTEAKLPEFTAPAAKEKADAALVEVKAPDLCFRYIGQVIRNVKVKESPAWLRERLESVGLRAINNIVDITNFVLMELGQPLHAFDLDKLEEKRIVVRRAEAGEKIVTLDGKNLTLSPENLVICDAKKPMALAGIMGGEYSGVTEETVDVMLESAVFDKSNIRRSSSKLGISSDSSYRFERGVDFDMSIIAHQRAAALIVELADGEVVNAPTDVYREIPPEAEILCRFENIRKLLGIDLDNNGMIKIFRSLQLKVKDITPDSCVVVAPRFRQDLTREADLAEEVARINGLDKIPEIPVKSTLCHSISDDAYVKSQELRDMLIALGLDECVHYSMNSLKDALKDNRFEEKDLIKLTNPISMDLAYLRPSLYGEVLSTVERNIARRNLSLKLFEYGKAFCANEKLFPEERWCIGIAITGQKHPEQYSGALKEVYDYYDLKGLLESFFEKCRIGRVEFIPVNGDSRFAPGVAAEIKLNGKSAGFLGEVNPDFVKGFRTGNKIYYAELEASVLSMMMRPAGHYKAISQFPATTRDVALVADESLNCVDIINLVYGAKLPNFESVKLFDIFRDDNMKKAGKKSMAFQVTFRNSERTLTDEEVNTAFNKLRQKLADTLKVELR